MALFNIFSNRVKKEFKSKKPRIVADIHEKNSLVLSELVARDLDLIIEKLEVGDYIIGETVIERKTSSDFISSMLNKRLFKQLKQLKNCQNCLLIIENYQELLEPRGNLNPNSIRGFILHIINNQKIPILFTNNSKETADYLFLLAKQQLKNQEEISLHSRKPKTGKEKMSYILESFEGIGPKNSKKLLKRFKTIKSIINSNPEDLKREIGKKSESFKIIDEEY